MNDRLRSAENRKKRSPVVLFDAVGTVIEPIDGVVDIYFRIGSQFGSRLSKREIASRISTARTRHFGCAESTTPPCRDSGAVPSDDALVSNDEIEKSLWRNVVTDVFPEIGCRDEVFDKLWDYFSKSTHWIVYDDVRPCLERLSELELRIGLASNFDSRLIPIAFELLPEFEFVFCSAKVGYRKPSPQFYHRVKQSISEFTINSDEASNSALEIWMIGDDFENDCAAPKQAGWNGFWLNRSANPNGAAHEFISTLHQFSDHVAQQVSV